MPFVCPNCHVDLPRIEACDSCSWEVFHRDGIPVLLSDNDKQSDLFSNYQDNYDTIASDDLESSIQNVHYLQNQTDKLFSYLPSLKGKDVAEIGVGQGNLFNLLLGSECRSVTGVDIASAYLKRLQDKPGASVLLANAENLPFRDQFDVVVATDILEHVLNPGDFAISLSRSTKLGGHCVVRVPYLENLITYAQQNGCPYRFVHLRAFEKNTLKCILEPAGFKALRFHYDGYLPESVRELPLKLRKRVRKRLVKSFGSAVDVSRIDNRLGRILMRPYEISVVAVKVAEV